MYALFFVQGQGMDNARNGWSIKIGGPAKKLQNNLKNWGIYNLNSIIINLILRILASQNRFQSLYDEIFNMDRFVE